MRVLADGSTAPDSSKAHLAYSTLRMARQFHDDEYFNGGVYFPYWLFQFAKGDGPVATMQQVNGNDLPHIFWIEGDVLHETVPAFHPDAMWPIGNSPAPSSQMPMVIQEDRAFPIAQILSDLEMFKDGFDPV